MIKRLFFAATAFVAVSMSANAQEVISQTGGEAPTLELDEDGYNKTAVACASSDPVTQQPLGISESTYFRAYTMSSDFNIGSVRVGVGSVSGEFPVTVTLYQSAGSFPGSFPDGLTELSSATATFTEDGEFSLVDIPITATVNSGDIIVVGVHNISTSTSDGGNGSLHYMGLAESETAPAYLLAEGCGLETPSTFASINFPNTPIIIDLVETEDPTSTENFAKLGLSVFPNPVSDVMNITSPEANIQAVTITDFNGRTVKSINFNNVAETTVDASDLASGVYLMNITANDTVATHKIVKK